MLIDFKELSKLIPDAGSLSLSLKKGKGDNLDVLFRAKHDLAQMKNNSARVSEEGKQIEVATKLLDQPYAFSATAEELNASFEEKITQPFESAKSLIELITDRTKALDEAAKSIRTSAPKTKTPEKTKVTGTEAIPAKTSEKTVKDAPLIGSLFGSVGADAGKGKSDDNSEEKSESVASVATGCAEREQEKLKDGEGDTAERHSEEKEAA